MPLTRPTKAAASVVLCLAAGCSLFTDALSISIPTGTLTFASVASSRTHSCALTPAGTAYCWGVNSSGELGDSSTTDRNLPTAVSGGLIFTSIAVGRSTTCGLVADGSAFCWGANTAGQFGDGTTTTRMVPTPAAIGHKFTSIGFSDPAQLPPYEVCGLETTGAVFCWGRNNSTPIAVAPGFSFTQLSAGIGGSFCGIVTSGDAYCWGFEFYSEIDIDSMVTSLTFTATPALVVGGHTFTSISVGYGHACGITTDAHLYCWGDNAFGQLGNGPIGHLALVPILVQGTGLYTTVSSGYDGSCAISTTEAAYCWGYSTFGNLGIGPVSDGVVVGAPEPVRGNGHFASLSKGLFNTCGVTTDRVAYCWGRGGSGLGIGNDGDRIVSADQPTKVGLQPRL
jgi:alpha-tubulin suppressor-like RCC1 family protein